MKLLILSLITSSLLLAAPAFYDKKEFELSNGETFSGHLKGDEYLNWIESDEGEILLFNRQSKHYEYAEIKDEELVPSGIEKNPDTQKRTRSSELSKEKVYNLWKTKREKELNRRQH